jgi:hypothetical protein
VLSRNLENEEAKSCYRAVENTTTMGCKARKTKKQVVLMSDDFSRIQANPTIQKKN